MKGGNSTLEGVIILVVLVVIVLITPKGAPNPSSNTASNNTNTGSSVSAKPTSSYAQSIYLGSGNASYTYQAYEEYVTITNSGRDTINITNWQLKNGKDRRAYDLGGALRQFRADIAIIPQAALFVSPSGGSVLQNVLLGAGETAIVTTGQIGSQLPYKIVSFKENICSGYLEDLPEYTFTPSLTRSCPRPADEPGISSLDNECRRFIERMPSCRTPEFETRDRDGNICYNCVDRQPLSSSCVAFIKSHFNYASCIAYHRNDSNFSGRTWRIFLGKGWEMWAKEYEVMELFDQLGRLVDSKTY